MFRRRMAGPNGAELRSSVSFIPFSTADSNFVVTRVRLDGLNRSMLCVFRCCVVRVLLGC